MGKIDWLDGSRRRKTPGTKRSARSKWPVLALIVFCGLVLVCYWPFQSHDPRRHRAVGKTLPRLALQPLTGDGKPVSLSDLSGRVVLINFWGTWCPPCRMELPHVADLYRKFRDRSAFRVLAVSCGRNMREDLGTLNYDTTSFLRQANIKMPTYADPGGLSRLAVDEVIGFDGYPTTVILDRDGSIRGVWTGFRPGVEHDMERLICQLLEEG